MANEPDTMPIHSLYAQRFAADLAANRKEQEDLSAQIAELQVRLGQLKADESWLCGLQGTLPPAVAQQAAATGGVASQPTPSVAEVAAPGAVPPPRQARKATKVTKARTTRKPAEAPAARAGEPPLRELLLALLVGAKEPRMVSEVTADLAAAHPGRPASTQVVRNTLEALAKKKVIEKEHKQGSVMYTAPQTSPDEPAPAVAAGAAPAQV